MLEKWLQDDCLKGWGTIENVSITYADDGQTYMVKLRLVGDKVATVVLRRDSEVALCAASVPDRALLASQGSAYWRNAVCRLPRDHDCPHTALTLSNHSVAIESLTIGAS
jgi:hypothetical protein